MGDLNGVEELRIKRSSLVVCPGECLLVGRDDPFDELDLFGPKKILAYCSDSSWASLGALCLEW